jgi:hypothetical protein
MSRCSISRSTAASTSLSGLRSSSMGDGAASAAALGHTPWHPSMNTTTRNDDLGFRDACEGGFATSRVGNDQRVHTSLPPPPDCCCSYWRSWRCFHRQ